MIRAVRVITSQVYTTYQYYQSKYYPATVGIYKLEKDKQDYYGVKLDIFTGFSALAGETEFVEYASVFDIGIKDIPSSTQPDLTHLRQGIQRGGSSPSYVFLEIPLLPGSIGQLPGLTLYGKIVPEDVNGKSRDVYQIALYGRAALGSPTYSYLYGYFRFILVDLYTFKINAPVGAGIQYTCNNETTTVLSGKSKSIDYTDTALKFTMKLVNIVAGKKFKEWTVTKTENNVTKTTVISSANPSSEITPVDGGTYTAVLEEADSFIIAAPEDTTVKYTYGTASGTVPSGGNAKVYISGATTTLILTLTLGETLYDKTFAEWTGTDAGGAPTRISTVNPSGAITPVNGYTYSARLAEKDAFRVAAPEGASIECTYKGETTTVYPGATERFLIEGTETFALYLVSASEELRLLYWTEKSATGTSIFSRTNPCPAVVPIAGCVYGAALTTGAEGGVATRLPIFTRTSNPKKPPVHATGASVLPLYDDGLPKTPPPPGTTTPQEGWATVEISWSESGYQDLDIMAGWYDSTVWVGWKPENKSDYGSDAAGIKWAGDNTSSGPELVAANSISPPQAANRTLIVHLNFYRKAENTGASPRATVSVWFGGVTLSKTVIPSTNEGNPATASDPCVTIIFAADGTPLTIN